MIHSRENNTEKRPYALFNSLPLIPSLKGYYAKTKNSNFLIQSGCNLAEATVRPFYQLSEPTLQRLDEYAHDKVHKSLALARNASTSAIKMAVWPGTFAFGFASHGLDMAADTPVGHVIEGVYDAADEVIDNILPAADSEKEKSQEDENSTRLDKKSPVRRVYRRMNAESLALLPSRTMNYSKKLSYSLGDRALSHALDVSAFLVNRSYHISTNVAYAIITATPGSKLVAERIGAHLVPSEKLARSLNTVLGGVLDQLKVWHRRANQAHMKQTVELIDTVTSLMKALQDKVLTSEEIRQGKQSSKSQRSSAPIHPTASQLRSQIELRHTTAKHRLESTEVPAKKARTEEEHVLSDTRGLRKKDDDEWSFVHYDHQKRVEAETHEEVHDYDSDDATKNNPFGLLSALTKEEVDDDSDEGTEQEEDTSSHIPTYAEVVQHPAAEVQQSEPEPVVEHPTITAHAKTPYATILQRPAVVYVDPVEAARKKEIESHQWHQVDHAHAAHGTEASLKPVEVDNPFVGLAVESPHIPEARHKEHKHHSSKPQTHAEEANISDAGSQPDEGWEVVVGKHKRHHDVYLNHAQVPQEWKEALQNPFDTLTNEESEEAQAYKCILDEYLDMVDAITPHDAARHDELTRTLKHKALLMKNARRTTIKKHETEVAREQDLETSRMDGEGAAMSHALPVGFAVPEPEELEASRMDAEGGAASHAIPIVSHTETPQQVELEKSRMDAEGAATSSAIPVHVPTDVFVNPKFSFADAVKAKVHTEESPADAPAPAQPGALVDPSHSFADVLKAGSAAV